MSEPEWSSTTTPEDGSIVHVHAEDDFGQYPVPFRILFKDDVERSHGRRACGVYRKMAGSQRCRLIETIKFLGPEKLKLS
jgi:hypothetical protein